eukprot:scaffold208825_cov32-Tisochrysis_lutea.AAC.6
MDPAARHKPALQCVRHGALHMHARGSDSQPASSRGRCRHPRILCVDVPGKQAHGRVVMVRGKLGPLRKTREQYES